ncbi:hypothetical protein [Gilliamella sp. Pas-s25]|uniref:hypothetical protein n=1 Tax=Gilliamella sp. Pas-s25 TaxID=2687310 RepID=UPI00135ECC5A|nr:hypothetical protein [Gilliamella sp. Pas-s25]MWP62180.1 hypothetical protein [Gilliamella sp. Pas-s25]
MGKIYISEQSKGDPEEASIMVYASKVGGFYIKIPNSNIRTIDPRQKAKMLETKPTKSI